MEKSISRIWHDFFALWPTAFRRKGIVVPQGGGEVIPFVDFVMSGDVLVVERPTPDSSGARRVVVPFQTIEQVKYTEPLKTEQFLKEGYVPGATAKKPDQGRVAKKVPIQPTVSGAPPTQQPMGSA
ncbi:MAG: hypothetical protein ACR2NU_00205 [Aeoliella sp.]